MNQQRDHREHDDQQFGAQPIGEWLNTLITSVMRMIGVGQPEPPAARHDTVGTAGRDTAGSGAPWSPAGPKRTLAGYINAGIYKFERARRTSAIAKQYQTTLRTIRLTRRAIRRAPRSSRYLFQGYTPVLKDARKRVRQLNAEIRRADAHLRQYNPPAIQDEIARLESELRSAASPATRDELEMRLEARRDLLETVRGFDERIGAMAAQLGSISAALELNHVKILTLGGMVTSTASDEILTARMQEVTEQLKLLEESLLEL